MCGISGLGKSQVEHWCWEKEQSCSLAEQTPAHTCRDSSLGWNWDWGFGESTCAWAAGAAEIWRGFCCINSPGPERCIFVKSKRENLKQSPNEISVWPRHYEIIFSWCRVTGSISSLCCLWKRGSVVLEGVHVLLCWAAEGRSLRFCLRLFCSPA